MILGLINQIRPILILRKAKIKLHHELRQHSPDLHVRQAFAHTPHGPNRERRERSLFPDEFWPTVPSLRDELVGMSICLC